MVLPERGGQIIRSLDSVQDRIHLKPLHALDPDGTGACQQGLHS